MNLSHIEQYFAQYLSAIENLSNDSAWIHIWDVTWYSIKKDFKSDKSHETEIDINNPQTLTKKYSFVRWILNIDWTEIKSDSDFSDFHKKIFKYIIDNDLEENHNYDNSAITTLENLLNEWYVIENEDKVDFNKEWWTNFYIKKENWSKTNNYFYYKWYTINTMYNYDYRIIVRLARVQF